MISLVTGGCGFVGRCLVKRLISLGHDVFVVDDLSTGIHPHKWINSDRLTFIYDDVREFFKYNSLPKFDYVFHFAAVIGGRTKIEGDPMSVATDISIDADFFRWACKERPAKILYTSSSAAYPIFLQTRINSTLLSEKSIDFDNPFIGVPDMTYGWTKLTGEYLANIAVNKYGLHIACVRPFSGYGEEQDESYPIPAIASRVARREDPLYIWGSGTQSRDFVHIEDCIDLMLIVVDKISDGSAINIGSGKPTTFYEVAEIFTKIAGYDPKIVPLQDKPMGVYNRCSDITRAMSFGWSPKISLEEGLRKVYETKIIKYNIEKIIKYNIEKR